jgi:hypothetical protein
MIITKHAIQRFRERVTEGSCDFIRRFIESELAQSIFLYSLNGIEKRYSNGLVYVLEGKKVITLYTHTVD